MSDIKPRVSIIIPHWNNTDILSDCLESITLTSYLDLETIVVDNASTDDSVEWVRSNYPKVKLIENDKNYGYAGGCNIGAEYASGEYLIFLNNDTTQDPNWVSNLVDTISSNSKIAAVQPKVLNYFDKNFFDYAGGAGGHMDIYCFPIARGRVFQHQEQDKGQYNDVDKCFWSSGTCFIVKKDLFIQANMFEDSFFAHMEEIDLCWKLQSMGYEVWVDPNALVYHKNALTLPMYSHKKYYLNHRNSLLMLFGNYSLKNAFLIGSTRITLEIVAFLYSILKFDLKHASAIIRSIVWILFNPHVIIKKRKQFSKIRKIDDNEIMRGMVKKSVVLEYYLKRRKTYQGILSK